MGIAGRASGWVLVSAVIVACSGKSNAPPSSPSGGVCLTDLASYCCSDSGGAACVGAFDAASQCAAWPSSTKVYVYASPCSGYKAVRVKGSWSQVYVYDASAASLVAVGDDAAHRQDANNTTVDCGAGPAGLAFPASCTATWLADSAAAPCATGGPSATSVCGGS